MFNLYLAYTLQLRPSHWTIRAGKVTSTNHGVEIIGRHRVVAQKLTGLTIITNHQA